MHQHHWTRFALMAGVALAAIASQDTKTQERFAGTWEAKFKDATICTLELNAGEKMTGSSRSCRINVNADGDLIEPDGPADADDSSAILDARIAGDTLSFTTKEKDDEVMKFEFKVTGDGEADLRILETAVQIKPIHFRRK